MRGRSFVARRRRKRTSSYQWSKGAKGGEVIEHEKDVSNRAARASSGKGSLARTALRRSPFENSASSFLPARKKVCLNFLSNVQWQSEQLQDQSANVQATGLHALHLNEPSAERHQSKDALSSVDSYASMSPSSTSSIGNGMSGDLVVLTAHNFSDTPRPNSSTAKRLAATIGDESFASGRLLTVDSDGPCASKTCTSAEEGVFGASCIRADGIELTLQTLNQKATLLVGRAINVL